MEPGAEPEVSAAASERSLANDWVRAAADVRQIGGSFRAGRVLVWQDCERRAEPDHSAAEAQGRSLKRPTG
ncbi:uncharacterized protein V6R79_021087 [Siganus canaliculatus]